MVGKEYAVGYGMASFGVGIDSPSDVYTDAIA